MSNLIVWDSETVVCFFKMRRGFREPWHLHVHDVELLSEMSAMHAVVPALMAQAAAISNELRQKIDKLPPQDL